MGNTPTVPQQPVTPPSKLNFDHIEGHSAIGPAPDESWLQKAGDVIREGAIGHAIEETFPNAPQWMKPTETVNNPDEATHKKEILPVGAAVPKTGTEKGFAEFGGGLTSAPNLLMLAGSGGLTRLGGQLLGNPTVVSKLVAAGFSTEQILDSAKAIPNIVKAVKSKHYDEAEQLMTEAGLGAIMGAVGFKEAGHSENPGLGTILDRSKAAAPDFSAIEDHAEVEPFNQIQGHEHTPVEITTQGPEWDRTHHMIVGDQHAGAVAYHVDAQGNAQIYGAHVPEPLRGQGIGTQGYQSVIEEASANPNIKKITSDSTGLTDDSARVWQKLWEQGYPVESIVHRNGQAGYQIDFDRPEELHVPTKTLTATPNTEIADSAQRYNKAIGQKEINHKSISLPPLEEKTQLADAYANAKHEPENPEVKASYDAMKRETKAQFMHAIKDLGIKYDFTKEDLYTSAEDMMQDLRDNHHLSVFTEGQPPPDHPLSETEPETGQSFNNLFRATHDTFSHAPNGNNFSEAGEHAAYGAHMQMYSPKAQPAVRTETQGQSNWFFNNRDVREGKTEPGAFPEQKATILPRRDEIVAEPKAQPTYHENLQKIADKYGLSQDASGVRGGASFITPDGQFIHLGSATHPDAIAGAVGPTPEGEADPRVNFIRDTNAVRTRFSKDRAGDTLHVSVPASGVTEDQMQSIKDAVRTSMPRHTGNLAMEVGEHGGKYAYTEFATANNVEPMLRQIQAHPEGAEVKTAMAHLEVPTEYKNRGYTPERILHHEAAHVIVGEKLGFPGVEIRTQFHPENKNTTSAASAHFDYSQIPGAHYDKDTASWKMNLRQLRTAPDLLNKFGAMLYAGGVANKLLQNIPLEQNQGMLGDEHMFNKMMDAAGVLSYEDRQTLRDAAVKLAETHLTEGDTLEKLQKHTAERAAGIPKTLHMDYAGIRRMMRDINGQQYDNSLHKANPPGLTRLRRGIGGNVYQEPRTDVAAGEGTTAPSMVGGSQKDFNFGTTGNPEAIHAPISALDFLRAFEPKPHVQPWNEKAAELREKNDGFTIDPRTGNEPVEADSNRTHMIEVLPEVRETLDHDATAQDIKNFADKNQVLLNKYPQLVIGGYKNELNLSAPGTEAGARIAGNRLDQESAWDVNRKELLPLEGKNKQTQFPEYSIPQRLADLRIGRDDMRISTRVPTAVGATEDPMANRLDINRAAIQTPELAQKLADRIKTYPGLKLPSNIKDPQKILTRFQNHLVDNIKFLWNSVPPETRATNSRWYESAHSLARNHAMKYVTTPAQSAGVIAAMSPQKAWDVNVSLGDRVQNIFANQKDTETTPEMMARGQMITRMKATVDPKTGETSSKSLNPKVLKILDNLKGKTLGQLTDRVEQAAWIRLYDEAHNSRDFDSIDPGTGLSRGVSSKSNGEPEKVAWGNLTEIGKAIAILEDGSRQNISQQLGQAHKVRNFYNNIIDPHGGEDVTIDTHAVAAGMLQPLGGNAQTVLDNFRGPRSAATGSMGTYPLIADAYRRAAKELDISQPRMLQSVVWEKIRQLFPDTFKTETNNKAIERFWKEYDNGKSSITETRDRILKYAGEHGGNLAPEE